MNKKKSKCCCIYEKPHRFGESDSEESDDECEHCFGHVERRRGKHKHAEDGSVTVQEESAEPTATITLQPPEPAPAPPDKPPQDG
ncbi:hypothetical protein O3G_MSEX007895 [Manduca sexta]|uniref:E3 ubiquitin-protein ligase PPP1R11 n=2 Tax=Manduca sexta TaxID=7130 RepID=A0A921Z8I8_MANSE|nr:hypothetical protein O3G_MSEX007895 [Manduca sexta]